MAAPAQQKPPATAARKPLPRNLRKATLAARVGHRVAESRTPKTQTRATTPTPAPVEVDIDLEDKAPSLGEVLESARPPRSLWLALLVIAVLGVVVLKRALAGLQLEQSDVFAFAHSTKEWAPKTLGFIDELVSQRQTAAPIPAQEGPREVALRRDGHVSIPGGILVFPSSFHPKADGGYDLLIHFHGNTKVVKESAEVANLDAAVAIVNLGIGSAPYEEYYAVPGTYEDLLAPIDSGLKRRGLPNPHVEHIALSGWSAGYGSISTILQLRRGKDPLDAILILDGIHAGWEGGALNARQLKPFADAAERAKKGEIYFGITHSAIDPKTYASTTATADYLLTSVDGSWTPRDAQRDAPHYLRLESMKGAVPPRLEKTMEPTREARVGSFHLLGYRGETKEHHMAHLFQMGATLLPELVARWR
jgi:hypothetical protein